MHLNPRLYYTSDEPGRARVSDCDCRYCSYVVLCCLRGGERLRLYRTHMWHYTSSRLSAPLVTAIPVVDTTPSLMTTPCHSTGLTKHGTCNQSHRPARATNIATLRATALAGVGAGGWNLPVPAGFSCGRRHL